nr:mucin-2-like isoform X8 [Nerophis lumbriciformis]XP_061789833.1 mucin-2-like isoform X9 [Nerophis lumbriciformis]
MLPALLFVVALTSCVAQTPETTTVTPSTSILISTVTPPTLTTTSTVTPPTLTTTSTVTFPTPPTKTIFAILEMRVQSSQALNVTDLGAVLHKLADLIATTNTSAIVTLAVKKIVELVTEK